MHALIASYVYENDWDSSLRNSINIHNTIHIICPQVSWLIKNINYGLVLRGSLILLSMFCSVHHLVQTAHDNSLVLSYGGQGSDPHLPSTK